MIFGEFRWTFTLGLLASLAFTGICEGRALGQTPTKQASKSAKVKKAPKAPADPRPGWMQDNDCVRKDEGGAGEEDEVIAVNPRTGLHFDEARPPEHATMLGQPDVLLFKVAAINELAQPTAAWVEVSVCGFEETCITAGSDFRLFGKRGRIEPGESRYAVFETSEKIGYGTHRVTFALFDESGQAVDWWMSESVTVGFSDIRVDQVLYPGHDASKGAAVRIVKDQPISFSVVASNLGAAPEAVTAIFAINGGGEYTCGIELYTDPTRIDAKQQGVVLSKSWETPRRGRHTLSVVLKDQKGKTIYESYGIPFALD